MNKKNTILTLAFAFSLVLALGVGNAKASPSPSGRDYFVIWFSQVQGCPDCPVVVEWDVWSFLLDGTFEGLRRFGSGSWTEHFIDEQLAIWSADEWHGAGNGWFFGITFPDDGRSLLASGVYTFDIAICDFFAIGFDPTLPPATTDEP
ncbi:MAG: hypothetical protein ACYS6K_16880 [Planctomycetota bacterium]|jgi:hypothetical protein